VGGSTFHFTVNPFCVRFSQVDYKARDQNIVLIFKNENIYVMRERH